VDRAELEAAGLYDPSAPAAEERLSLLEYLISQGVPQDELQQAAAERRLVSVLGDRLIRPGRAELTIGRVRVFAPFPDTGDSGCSKGPAHAKFSLTTQWAPRILTATRATVGAMEQWDDPEPPIRQQPSAPPDPAPPVAERPVSEAGPPGFESFTAAGFPPPARRRTSRVLWALAASSALVLGIGGARLLVGGKSAHFSSGAARRSSQVNTVSQRKLSPSEIAAKVDPALVDITSTLGYDKAKSVGTGMVLTSSGEVLTNNHVIDGATSISVKISTGSKSYRAKVVGTDPTDDIAVLQIEGASGLATLPLGNSSKVSVGDSVVAIGNALDRPGAPTVTQGNVIALGRSITVRDATEGPQRLSDLFEFDAQLEPGDSGGPLLDKAGRVVGMNTAASTGAFGDTSSNDGFAIPTNNITSIVHQIESGRADTKVHIGARAFLGVQLQDANGLSGSRGRLIPGGGGTQSSSSAVVLGVEPGTPADDAGLTAGDMITSFDGAPVSSSSMLSQLITAKRPGDAVRMTWLDRAGTQRSGDVRLTTGPAD
jgi:S1-C subfamily serine protease